MYDVIIIGAGVTGCAVARYLSRYQGSALVLERAEDVCCGTSKANSAIIHAGFDAAHGSLMAKMNVQGNRMLPELAKELDFPFRMNGSLVVCMSEEDMPRLRALYENGVKNGVEGLEIVDAQRLHELEPNVSKNAVAALWAPTGGIVCPFNMTIALAENANANGVDFRFNTKVTGFTRGEEGWTVHTEQGDFQTRYVVNAAGVYADVLHNMVSARKLHITPRRGDYCLLDRQVGGFVSHTVFQLPGKLGKGVLVSPTVHGNIIVGPTAIDIEDRDGTNTTAAGLEELIAKAGISVDNLPIRQTITSFAGLRAHEDHHEFVIGEAEDAPGFVDCAGIESPGLTSAPAIGLSVAELLREKLDLRKKEDFIATRKGLLDPKSLTKEAYQALIRENPAYGQIICRCEQVTEGEIIDAIRRPLGARSLDGVKRRTRAGMGRCQAGFCSPRVLEILARELGVSQAEITKCGGASRLIVGVNKDSLEEVREG
ncbi:MAG: NAD(P)/FAD-dependent oxidoreductase [Candidatus Faecousia sp.]|nr:NAD(P)/FAD-dependent oxidoreductase [Candidatus Faecousia sp.]